MRHKILSFILMFTLLFSLPLTTNTVWAANEIGIKQTVGTVSMEGVSRTKLSVEITNNTDSQLTDVVATINSSALTYEPYTDKSVELGTLDGKKKATATWEMNTSKLELGKTYKLPVTVTSKEGYKSTIDAVIYIFADSNTSTGEQTSKAVLSVNPTSGSLKADSTASLTITVNNTGNTNLNDVVVNLSSLPEGVTLYNTNAFLSLGSLLSGKTKSIDIPIAISNSVTTGNYPFGITANAVNDANAAVTFSQTNYIEIAGGVNKSSMLSITSLVLPSQATSGKEFEVSFNVRNDSGYDANDVKITVKPGEGLVNKTKNIFSEPKFSSGTNKSYSVTLFSLDDVENKNIPIEIVIERKNGDTVDSTSQFEGVFIGPSSGSGNVKTPQLIVNSYNYGGDSVNASEEFTLTYTLYNTSTERSLRNIKIAMSSEEGTFIPVGASNTMYITSIDAGKSSTQSIRLTTKPDAKQSTIPVYLDMTYEDNKGNEYSAKETISVPVIQSTKLKIDEPNMPMEVYPGQQAGINLDFYNVGKTTLSNLIVSAEGNFDTPSSQNYFVGNLEPGKQDSYDLALIPREPGMVEGKILFTFEDAAGVQQVIEQTFSLNAVEPPVYPEEEITLPEENAGLSTLQKSLIGITIFAIALVVFVILRRNKKKKEQELTIDEE